MRKHPLQQTLWDVLDDLIEAHNSATSSSLFAASVKPSIRKTAAEFLDMMPGKQDAAAAANAAAAAAAADDDDDDENIKVLFLHL